MCFRGYAHDGASNWACPPAGYTSNASETYASAMGPFCSPARLREMEKTRNVMCNYWQKIKPQCGLTCCKLESTGHSGQRRLRNSVPYRNCNENKTNGCTSIFPSPTTSYDSGTVKQAVDNKSCAGGGASSPLQRVQPPPPVSRRPLRNLYKDSYSAWNYDSDCNNINGYDVRPNNLSDLYDDDAMPMCNGELYDMACSLSGVKGKGNNDMLPFGGGEKGDINKKTTTPIKPSVTHANVDKRKHIISKENRKPRGSGSSSGNYILVKTTKTILRKKLSS